MQESSKKPYTYIKSILSMNSPLAVKRLLKQKGIIAQRGDLVNPKIEITVVPQMALMDTVIKNISIERKARSVTLPKEISERVSKYTINVD